MSQIIAVTAGKGGTGKSTTSANVARGLAALGKRTLLVELDFGLRCLDIMLGIKDKVKHDIGEYLEGKIDILTATTKVETVENLYLVCATRNPFMDNKPRKDYGRLRRNASAFRLHNHRHGRCRKLGVQRYQGG